MRRQKSPLIGEKLYLVTSVLVTDTANIGGNPLHSGRTVVAHRCATAVQTENPSAQRNAQWSHTGVHVRAQWLSPVRGPLCGTVQCCAPLCSRAREGGESGPLPCLPPGAATGAALQRQVALPGYGGCRAASKPLSGPDI